MVKVPYFVVHKQNSKSETVDQYWTAEARDITSSIERIIFEKSVKLFVSSFVDVKFFAVLFYIFFACLLLLPHLEIFLNFDV